MSLGRAPGSSYFSFLNATYLSDLDFPHTWSMAGDNNKSSSGACGLDGAPMVVSGAAYPPVRFV